MGFPIADSLTSMVLGAEQGDPETHADGPLPEESDRGWLVGPLATELLHRPDEPAGVAEKSAAGGSLGLASELLHRPDEPAGVRSLATGPPESFRAHRARPKIRDGQKTEKS